MKNIIFFASLTLFVLFIFGCSKNADESGPLEDFVNQYGGKPFKGSAKGQITTDGQVNYQWSGDGVVALMDPTADSVSMVFMAGIGQDGEINFKVRGTYTKTEFRAGDTPSQTFTVNNEQINGRIINSAQSMAFTGNLQREKAIVHMQVEFLEETDGFPKNSVLDLWFDTQRNISDGNDTSGCQTRLVPIWSPSGVTMGIVPDC